MRELAKDHPDLDARLDDPFRHELDERQARELELQKQARSNRAALALLGGVQFKK